MGGIGVATAAQVGLGAANLLSANRNNNKKMDVLSQNQQASIRNRKNLLEQQLASRRAGLSTMGLTSSKSAAAVQKRIAKDSYDDLADENENYQRQYQSLQEENDRNIRQGVLSTVLSTTNKLIK